MTSPSSHPPSSSNEPVLEPVLASNLGLLIARVGMGSMFMLHGWPKLVGGPEGWAGLGEAMTHFGIGFGATFWGFCAATSEFGGGLLLLLGLFVTPAAVGLSLTMVVAAGMHIASGHGIGQASHALESLSVFVALALLGPGEWSLSARWARARQARMRQGTGGS